MSRWAETFAALSRGNDTNDTRSETRPQVEPSVACVETVVTIGGGHSWAPKPAEMLEVERLAEPSVPCVTSVVDRKDQEARLAASPPPGASPRLSGLPTLLAHPPAVKEKMPQLSGWPSYLKGRVPLILPALFGGPSKAWSQRHRSTPPGTPRMETT